jgi:glycosyltransferase involved in cell wall biosynthesis
MSKRAAGKARHVLVTVVVRSYNYARYLTHAIESSLAQMYAPLEIIVVDDGSTDRSQDLIRSYGARITPILKENGGMASSLEAGLEASHGDILIFLDADDVLLPSAVETAVEAFRDSRVVKVHWPLIEIDQDGRPTGRMLPRRPLPEGDLREAVIADGPMSGDGPPTSGNAWSRAFLESALPMPEPRVGYHADSYLHTLAAVRGVIGKVPEPLTLYRAHSANAYHTMILQDRLTRDLTMYHYRCRLLSAELRACGVNVDPASWKTGNSYYEQLVRRFTVVHQIDALIPRGERFILVDEGASGSRPILPDRTVVRFPSVASDPRGRPANDDAAVMDLEKMRLAGAGFVVFIKPALWWLDSYQGLRHHLESHYSCDLVTENLVAFDLRNGASSSA